jgi:hypothetical protein
MVSADGRRYVARSFWATFTDNTQHRTCPWISAPQHRHSGRSTGLVARTWKGSVLVACIIRWSMGRVSENVGVLRVGLHHAGCGTNKVSLSHLLHAGNRRTNSIAAQSFTALHGSSTRTFAGHWRSASVQTQSYRRNSVSSHSPVRASGAFEDFGRVGRMQLLTAYSPLAGRTARVFLQRLKCGTLDSALVPARLGFEHPWDHDAS